MKYFPNIKGLNGVTLTESEPLYNHLTSCSFVIVSRFFITLINSMIVHVQYFDTFSFEIFWPEFEWLSDEIIYGHISFEQKKGGFCTPCIVKAKRRWFCFVEMSNKELSASGNKLLKVTPEGKWGGEFLWKTRRAEQNIREHSITYLCSKQTRAVVSGFTKSDKSFAYWL